ncbi:MAG: hypothetical protein CMI31_03245 [Opitutae bacterium]|nr:hypothetical protein [Opitutae bacterium]
MRIDRYIAASRIVDLKSKDIASAYAELLKVCKLPPKRGCSRKKILAELLEREKTITSYLGSGVALPHARVQMDRPYMLAVGRCPKGLQREDAETGESVRFVFLLLAAKSARDYLRFLAALAKTFQDPDTMEPLRKATNLEDFRSAVRIAFGAPSTKPSRKRASINRLFISESKKVAKGSGCSSVLMFLDVFSHGREPKVNFPGMTVALAGEDLNERSLDGVKAKAILNVRTVSGGRLSRVRGAILLGLTRGIFKFEDKVLCLTGVPESDQLDTMLVLDVDEEFGAVLAREGKMLPSDVSPQALEYLLGIATQLAVVGREGKPLGALFVLGDTENVMQYVKPLILNPFRGYAEEDRNVLNPFMDETLKELAHVDGAFVIRGDGVVETAGSMIEASAENVKLHAGLGTRHAAAASITQKTDSLAIVVSQSGQVTLFRKGTMFPLYEKSDGPRMRRRR